MLCPQRALSAFEAAGKLGNAIGAYNTAMMRLERAGEGDREQALALLKRASDLGDQKSGALLRSLAATGR